MRVQPRANPYLGRFLWSDLLNRLPAPAALRPRGRRAMVSVVLAAGVGVTGSTAVATSAAALLAGGSTRPPTGAESTAQLEKAAAEAVEAQIAAETALEPPAPVPGYVAAGNAAVGVPGAAPQMSLTRVLRRARPKPKPKLRPIANRAAVTSVLAPAISIERWVDPLPEAKVTSCFGMRWGRPHEGVDLAAPDHTPILAAGAGEVVSAGPAQGYGNQVLIDHHDGYLTHYAHLSVIDVKAGQLVAAGQQIGEEGATGHTTGPHLHFEVHLGFYKNPIEPTEWLRDHGVPISGCLAGTSRVTP